MEEAAGVKANADPPPPQEVAVEGPRRRAGGQKRKASAAGGGSNSSAPSKRLAKERPLPSVPPAHNGPCTRARQSPNKFAAAAVAIAVQPELGVPSPSPVLQRAAEKVAAPRGVVAAEETLKEPEPTIEAQFEAVKTRGANAHAIPAPAGWFSWTKIHPLEERSMASFFNGKSEERTSELYMNIRNAIMKKFHANPQTNIELKDLSEISAGHSDTKQEVMEFLDYWGLINFHPFPPQRATDATEVNQSNKASSLTEKLYYFEPVESCAPVISKTAKSEPTTFQQLLPDSSIFEDLVRPEGPSVEYHCNSCSADCSRKRYHCQTQADFDLCMDCYNYGKFGSGMTSADFILMEPAEASGGGGGSWTDQETLLLLEALELFGENWSEIAEHVATKTKTQCMLHFMQMPIEDTFLEEKDDVDVGPQQNTDLDSSRKDPSSDVAMETKEAETASNEEPSNPVPVDTSKLKDASGICDSAEENESNFALDALKAAFKAVGSLPTAGGFLSLTEAANPVMTLAAYLAGLVENDVAIASAQSSLKAMYEESPSIQLAARHCVLLEDPPSGKEYAAPYDKKDILSTDKDLPVSKSAATDTVEGKSGKIENIYATDYADKDAGNNTAKEESPLSSQECTTIALTTEKVVPNSAKESSQLHLHGDCMTATSKEKKVSSSEVLGENPSSAVKGSTNVANFEELKPNVESIKDAAELASDKEETPYISAKKDSGADAHCSDVMKAVDIVNDSVPVEEKNSQQIVSSGSTREASPIETGGNTAENDGKVLDNSNEKNDGTMERKGDCNIHRIKLAAIAALSAAAVKAKLLANQEEDHIRELASLLIEKQLHKLETKLSLFAEMEMVILRVREHLDRARQRLYQERAQIIAARLGLPASSARPPASSLNPSRAAVNYATAGPRPPGVATSQLQFKGTPTAQQSKV